MRNPLFFLRYNAGVTSFLRERGLIARACGVALLAWVVAFLAGCHPASKDPVTLTFLDPEWSHDSRERDASHEQVLTDFTRETGIRVTHLPGPENASAQLELTERLLKKGAATPDVYGIDVIWPGILSEYLIDLKPYFAAESQTSDADLIANYTVKGRLVAMPYHSNIGALFFRTDLLQKYGYRQPPRTWDELEKMATRIQAGERAKGQKDFWGFVWPGAANEALFCDAIEWQASAGGGHVVEADGAVSVNNPNTIRAWKRVTHWIGTISPPTALSYEEWDSSNAFWTSGRAAFQRGWESDYFLANPVLGYPFHPQSGVTSVPGEKDGVRVGTLGGLGLAVSRTSQHQTEAIAFVRFLLKKEAELDQRRATTAPPKFPIRFEIPTILTAYTHQQETGGTPGARVVARPSTVTGRKYSAVSAAYVQALHSVLERKVDAERAVSSLQGQISQIMTSSAPTQ